VAIVGVKVRNEEKRGNAELHVWHVKLAVHVLGRSYLDLNERGDTPSINPDISTSLLTWIDRLIPGSVAI